MKTASRKLFFVLLTCVAASYAGDEMKGRKTRIGVFDPEVSGDDKRLVADAVRGIKESVAAIGGYDIYLQNAMEKGFAENRIRFPRYCREPRCAAAVGNALQLDRMIYGDIDKSEKTFGVRFTLVDVASKQVIENVSIEGGAGVPLADVIRASITRLHGHVDPNLDTVTHTYYGKQVDNLKQFYISAGACLAAGLIWGLVNNQYIDGDNLPHTDELAGVATGSGLIPICARPAALGNAYIAASDDAYGVFYNPAGLSWVGGREVSFGYQYRFGLLNNFFASYVNKATRELGFGQGFQYTGDNEDLYQEVTFISGVAYRFNELLPFLRPLSIGANVKIMSKRTGSGAVGLDAQQGSGFGFGLDLGMQLELSKKIRGAILFESLPSVIKYNNTSSNTEYNENEPIRFLFGGSFQANYETFLICELTIPLYREQAWAGRAGVERSFFRILVVRAGVEKAEGFDSPWKINGGAGAKIPFRSQYLLIDSAYEYNTLNPFSNVLNFSFRFGF